MLKVAILGFGTVGSGVYEILKNKSYQALSDTDCELKYILDIRDFEDTEVQKYLTKDFNVILNDDEVCVVAEVMGGLHPAYEFTKSLLEKGVSVVTSNKELVATYGKELLEIAKDNNANYMFEASVGGGIPIIRPLSVCLKANKIKKIAGILNGTTNFILNEMFTKGKSFDDALHDAQEKGYAEKNPAADVEGHDACRKIAILSSMAWGNFVDYNKISTKGITKITKEDVKYAEKLNSVIKLIGYADIDENDKIYASVSPMLVSDKNMLSNVNDVFNAVAVEGDSLGQAMFYAKGAGKLPTASAVVADILDCARHIGKDKHNILWGNLNENSLQKEEDRIESYFIRCKDSKEDIVSIFGPVDFVDIFDDEIGFAVDNIKNLDYKEKVSKLKSIISEMKKLS